MNLQKIFEMKGDNDIIKIDHSKNVRNVIEMLNEHRIGSLLVVKDGKLDGIVTERDVLYKCLNNKKKDDTLVTEIMTPKEDLIIATKDDTLTYAMKVMINNNIRHLPVIDRDKILGIISMKDIIRRVLQQSENEVKLLREHIKNPYGVNL